MSSFDLSKFLYVEEPLPNMNLSEYPLKYSVLELKSPSISLNRTEKSSSSSSSSSGSKSSNHKDNCNGNGHEKKEQKPSMLSSPISSSSSSSSSSSLLKKGLLCEKYASPGKPEKALRMIIVGHNPSEKSWIQGHYYANPSNRMWFILRECGIVPTHYGPINDDDCPYELGIGFTDLGTGYPETDSSKISDKLAQEWSISLYQRLIAHKIRAKAYYELSLSNQSSIAKIKDEGKKDNDIIDCSPKIITFAGVRQWKALFPSNFFTSSPSKKRKYFDILDQSSLSSVEDRNTLNHLSNKNQLSKLNSKSKEGFEFRYGLQTVRPTNWPVELMNCEVYVMPSTSGAAAMTNEERIGPYRELANRLKDIPWAL